MHSYLVALDNATVEEEVEEDGATHVKCMREVVFETGKKLLS